MVTEIRLYIEGGGRGASGDFLREGFHRFFRELVAQARGKGIRWRTITCGSCTRTVDDFWDGRQDHPQAVCLLLVDSEGPVTEATWRHLQQRDGWQRLTDTMDDQCHLMVQAMEAWLIADVESLRRYYGQRFNAGALPSPTTIEQIEPARLMSALRVATRQTSKGEYRKVQHGSELLGQVDAARVRAVAPHCERLFETLRRLIDAG